MAGAAQRFGRIDVMINNAGYGIFWFLGSALMGIFYDISIPALVAFSVITQLVSIPFFMMAKEA